MAPDDRPPRKRWRRTLKPLAALLALLFATVAALPWLATTGPPRRWLVGKVNAALAPSQVAVGSIRLSWFGSLAATDLALIDGTGRTLLAARSVSVDRGLIALATHRPIRATVTIAGADLDVERRADGSIDLLDALGPVLNAPPKPKATTTARSAPGPGPDLTLKVESGTVRVRAPELPEPLTVSTLEASIHLPGSGPLTGRVALGAPAPGVDATLEVTGQYDLPAADLSATLSGKAWPWAVSTAGVVARGQYDGTLTAQRQGGRWTVSSDAKVLKLDANGPTLAGDRLRLDTVGARCDVSQTAAGWDVRRLDVTSPLGSLKGGGTYAATGAALKVEGQLDLAALAKQLPHLLHLQDGLTLQGGSAHLTVSLVDGTAAEGRRYSIEARVSNVVARQGTKAIAPRDPATLSALAIQRADGFRVERLTVKTAFLNASGSGDHEKGVTLSAAFDLERMQTELRDLIDFGGIELAGQGRLAADYRPGAKGTYAGRFAAEVRGGRVQGLSAEPIARKLIRIDAAATGPIAANGLPADCGVARLGVKADDLDAGTKVFRDPSDQAIRIDDLHLTMQLPAPATDPIRFVARGRFQPKTGVLDLKGLTDAEAPEPIALGAGGVHVEGLGQGGKIGSTADLAADLEKLDRAVAALTGSAVNGVAGVVTLKCGAWLKTDGSLKVAGGLNSTEVSMPRTDPPGRRSHGPFTIALDATRPGGSDRIDLAKLWLGCKYATVDVAGSLADPLGKRLADLHGTIVPNWVVIDHLLGETLEPGAKVRGEVRPFRLKGPLSGPTVGAVVQGLDAELAVDKFAALAYGARIAPTSVVVRCAARQVTIDPINTTINNGKAHLLPQVAIDDQGAIALRLADGTAIDEAEINDEVSKKLLAFIAPVLHEASQVSGKVSVHVSRGEFPLVGSEKAQMLVTSRIEFDDVTFTAGGFANKLTGLAGKGSEVLRIAQPIDLTIANGRIEQKGLALIVGRDTRIELDGSVGFDRTLALKARVPISGKLLGKQADLDKVLQGLRVGVPIGGTLAQPTIDDHAFKVAAREAAKKLMQRGAGDFLKGLLKPEAAAPRDPLR